MERLISAAGFDPVKAGGLQAAGRIESRGGDLQESGLGGWSTPSASDPDQVAGRGNEPHGPFGLLPASGSRRIAWTASAVTLRSRLQALGRGVEDRSPVPGRQHTARPGSSTRITCAQEPSQTQQGRTGHLPTAASGRSVGPLTDLKIRRRDVKELLPKLVPAVLGFETASVVDAIGSVVGRSHS